VNAELCLDTCTQYVRTIKPTNRNNMQHINEKMLGNQSSAKHVNLPIQLNVIVIDETLVAFMASSTIPA
jgi:hypothetical protein